MPLVQVLISKINNGSCLANESPSSPLCQLNNQTVPTKRSWCSDSHPSITEPRNWHSRGQEN